MQEYWVNASHPVYKQAVDHGISLLGERRTRGGGVISFKEGQGVCGVEAASPAAKKFMRELFARSEYDGKSVQGLSLTTVLGDVVELAHTGGHKVTHTKGRGKNAGVTYQHISPKFTSSEN